MVVQDSIKKAALDEDLKLLGDFLPALRKLVVEEHGGDSMFDQEEVAIAASARGRFPTSLCCKMIQAIASGAASPVVLVIEDLQHGLIWTASKSFAAYSSARIAKDCWVLARTAVTRYTTTITS